MAKVATKTRVTKKQVIEHRTRATKDLSPKWDGHESMTADDFSRHFRHSMDYYRMEFSGKDLKPKVINWMSANGYTKEQIAEFKKTKDNRCGTTIGAIAACLLKGMPPVRADFNDGRSSAVWLGQAIAKVVAEGKDDIDDSEEVEVKPAGLIVSIQERVREASYKMTEEIETAIEAFQTDPETFDPKAFKVLNLLKAHQAKAAHARIIKDFYARDLDELVEAATTKDEQLKEAYAHLSKVQLRKITAFYQEIVSACEMLAQEAKVNRKPKAKKAVPAEKIVAKLKYKKADEPLKLVSINPADILGAKELWTYNTKSRKLGKYVAEEFRDLGIKGTTITGFSEVKSVQKTLRKPAEQIKAFKDSGKVQLRKFLDDINAVDTRMNGRISEDIILLKIA